MPRVVIFHLLTGSPAEVEALLNGSGFSRSGLDVEVSPFDAATHRENSKEEFDLLVEQLGHPPCVDVFVDIPYSKPGLPNLRWLAALLLSQFGGVAIDEDSGYDHAWTLEEIQQDALIDGRRFFQNDR